MPSAILRTTSLRRPCPDPALVKLSAHHCLRGFMPTEPESPDAPVPLPITGELDLHTFQPCDLGELIPACLDACRARNILSVRIIHGKGTGTLRTTVHTLLQESRHVHSYRLGDESSGSWGATMVSLLPPGSERA